VNDVRARTLAFFGADPEEYDLVFVANSTAAIKLVADGFRDYCAPPRDEDGKRGALRRRFRWLLGRGRRKAKKSAREFHYYYHRDAHTSVVGVRELSARHACLGSDDDVARWIRELPSTSAAAPSAVSLLAYPGQSNMTGRRLPLSWSADVHRQGAAAYTLLDAAALATTKELRVSEWQPDFVAVSFYKIFGFPDLGALLVRRTPPAPGAPTPGEILTARRYFGGGTVDMVAALGASWHARKSATLHDALEEGTVPFHSVVALGHALDAMRRVFGGVAAVGAHTAALTRELHAGLAALRHKGGAPLVRVHNEPGARFGDPEVQGATVAFSVLGAPAAPTASSASSSSAASECHGDEKREHGDQPAFGYGAVERLADARAIYVRSGSLCNPGGFAAYLGWSAAQLAAALAAGHSCSNPREAALGKPTGVVRVSLGACSSRADVVRVLRFVEDEFRDRRAGPEGEVLPRGESGEAAPPEDGEGGGGARPAARPAVPARRTSVGPGAAALPAAPPAARSPPARASSAGALAVWRTPCAEGARCHGAAKAVAKMPGKKAFVGSVVERQTVVTTAVTEI
jgi:molybdenum cofactor sulfurtransferase